MPPVHHPNPALDAANGLVLQGLVGIAPAPADLGLAMEKDRDLPIGPLLPPPVEGGKGIAVAHTLHRAVPQPLWRRTVAVEIGEGLGEPQAPLDIGKSVENDFKNERLDADMPAGAIELNGPPAVGQQQRLLVLADSENSLAAARRVDPDKVSRLRIDGFADAR